MLFCTPIWWGGRSSLMQRVIERLDALDEEYSATGRSAIKGKVAGIVITGSEDGALSVMGSIMMVLSWMGFTLPPECAAYWVGEVGQPTSQDRDKRLRNMATMHMAKGLAQNLVLLRAAAEGASADADRGKGDVLRDARESRCASVTPVIRVARVMNASGG